MISELSRAARLVVVNTHHARSVVLEAGGTTTSVIPLAVPSRADLHLVDSGPTDPPTISTFGILSATKRPDLVVDAFAELRRERRATLAFVGPSDDEVRAALESRAASAGLLSDVVFTGHVDARGYGRWLSRTSVAVQLRREQNGARSGAIADAHGASIPVVTDMEAEQDAAAAFVEPGCSASALAGAIAEALDRPRPRYEHPSYDDVAGRLVTALEDS